MNLIKVKSSNVVAVGYENNTLYVQYNSGTYSYSNVDRTVYENLLKAESKGKFMNSEIKHKYSYRKLWDYLFSSLDGLYETVCIVL